MATGEQEFGEASTHLHAPTRTHKKNCRFFGQHWPAKSSSCVPVCDNSFGIARSEEMARVNSTKVNHKVFVGTWNVGGVPPPDDGLNLEEWLGINDHSFDIYVIGFQEIVPLSARNVLGPENSNISTRWNSLIRTTLNKSLNNPRNSRPSDLVMKKNKVQSVSHGCDHAERFTCIISKQMVGILISVWARSDLSEHVSGASVSRVGCGVMGYLGNKGSVSVRFCLHETSFCFVCCHLASGGKVGDEKHRNSDALDIFSRTCFASDPSLHLPKKILHHDRVVLFGDLNYRISLPEAKILALVKQKQWNLLLEKDQLRRELSEGRAFEGWNEGAIAFSPTYKYYKNSNQYQGFVHGKNKEKRRAPAWCDRILWFGDGMKQNRYERCELKLSDHRPVRAVFTVEVEVLGYLI